MDATAHQVASRIIDETVTGAGVFAGKNSGHDVDAKVATGADAIRRAGLS